MLTLIISFLVTVVIEFVILLLLTKKSWKELLPIVFFINAFTQPLANYIYRYVFYNFLVIEIGVVLVEGVLLRLLLALNGKRAIFFSLLTNSITAALSILFK